MSAANIFSISYGGVTIGGASTDYQLHNPYVLEKNYETFRMVFAAVITAPDHATLESRSTFLESTFRRRLVRGDVLDINLNQNSQTYHVGQDLLHVTATCTKSGDPASDKSFSRLYTITIQAELPADNSTDNGLRNIELLADNSPSNQTTVTVRGTYTATASGEAVTNFTNNVDANVATYLTFIDSSATFELVKEDFSLDRERSGVGSLTPYPHVCNFTRQYVQLLAPQNTQIGGLNDPDIRDHRITYTEVGTFLGDGVRSLDKLYRVSGTYDCAVDFARTDDLQGTYINKVRPTVISLFKDDFSPKVFCIEDFRTAYDETQKRISATFTFLYQATGGQPVVEVSYSAAYNESRTINYTPTHQADELSAYADVGWMVLTRVFTRRVVVVGLETPKLRMSQDPEANDAGLFKDTITDEPGPDNRPGTQLNASGWNMIDQSSEAVPKYIGFPGGADQLQVTELTERIVERFHRAPQRTLTGSGGRQRGPTTPNG
jgi:hypothetical protein